MTSFFSLLRRLESEEISALSSTSLHLCGAFSSPTERSLERLVSAIEPLCPLRFWDLGSGTGLVVAAVAKGIEDCDAWGIELNETLHDAALRICIRAGEKLGLKRADLRDMGKQPARTAFYAFDLRYPDDLVRRIAESFASTPIEAHLLTTKNEQGLGAALCGVTEELRNATEDLATCLEDRPSASEIEEARRRLEELRERATKAYESLGPEVDLVDSFDFFFGEGEEEEGEESTRAVEARQDENVTEEIDEEYCERLRRKEREGPGEGLEKTRMHVFSKIDCSGCRRPYQANQLAHSGGCMGEEWDDLF